MTGEQRKWTLGQKVMFWLTALPFLIIGVVVMAFLVCEMNKAFWDFRVRPMCEQDGGITVLHRVATPTKYLRADGDIIIPPLPDPPDRPPFNWEAHPDDSFYLVREVELLRDGFIKIRRHSTKIVDASSRAVLGEAVVYGRGGGDLPTGITHGSSFLCPKSLDLAKAVFLPSESNEKIEEFQP